MKIFQKFFTLFALYRHSLSNNVGWNTGRSVLMRARRSWAAFSSLLLSSSVSFNSYGCSCGLLVHN